MRRTRLAWQLVPTYLLITLVSVVALGWYSAATLRDSYTRRTYTDLTARAQLLAAQTASALATTPPQLVQSRCQSLGGSLDTRFTVIGRDGVVLGDSEHDPATMENHRDRPEVMMALAGGIGRKTRLSTTMGENEMYVAVPIRTTGPVLGVSRAAVSLRTLNEEMGSLYWQVGKGGIVIAILVTIVTILISQRIAHPIEALRGVAEKFADGDFEERLPQPTSYELAGLSDAVNQMAMQLDERLATISTQRTEREAILASMVESMIAVDMDDCVLAMNPAAEAILGVTEESTRGRPVQEVVRNADLHRFIFQAFHSPGVSQGQIVLREGEERHLLATGSPLRDPDGGRLGILIVLNDVTQLRRLERVRTDFVSNVSHELKTPIAAIRGAVETLQGGDVTRPEDMQTFLGIIARHTNRLNQIIDDLLSLARLEESTEKLTAGLEPALLRPALEGALQDCARAAEQARIELKLDCASELTARINQPLLEQAVTNLIENAIRHSAAGKTVWIEADKGPHFIRIRVRDEGSGIEAQHLARIFERFYRADSSRDRKAGGTGLGLSIVKHIVQAHEGEIDVKSVVGSGSVFTIRLPSEA